MRVRELLAALQGYDADDVVVLSRDEEGNGYLPLAALEPMRFRRHDGEAGYRELTDSLARQGYGEEDILGADEGENCVVLWPGWRSWRRPGIEGEGESDG